MSAFPMTTGAALLPAVTSTLRRVRSLVLRPCRLVVAQDAAVGRR
jgi:hypothetical protein